MLESPLDGRSRRLLAWLLAALCGRQLIATAWAIGPSLLVGLLVAVGLAALLLFALRRWPIGSGFVALSALSALSQTHALIAGGPMRHEFAVGVALLGWLCGLLYAGNVGVHAAEALAEIGAAAALSATYLNAGISKLSSGALSWAESATLRSMLAAHVRVDDLGLGARYAHLILDHAQLAQALSWATLIVQLGAVLFLVGRRSRALWGTLILLFHLNVAILTGIHYQGAVFLIALLSYPWPRWLAPPVAAE